MLPWFKINIFLYVRRNFLNEKIKHETISKCYCRFLAAYFWYRAEALMAENLTGSGIEEKTKTLKSSLQHIISNNFLLENTESKKNVTWHKNTSRMIRVINGINSKYNIEESRWIHFEYFCDLHKYFRLANAYS